MAEDKNIHELTFDTLNINDNLLRGIYSYGFEKPSRIQHLSIPIINKGTDIIAQSQSGTGKTGAFSIGILNNIEESVKKTQYIIVTPTHELAKQIYDVIVNLSEYMDITIVKVIGKTNIRDSIHELSKDPQIIVATPGRLLDMIQKKHVFTDSIKALVLDEADEMLSYGFMENIHNIIRTIPQNSQICLFSATMPKEILHDKQLTEIEIAYKNETLHGQQITAKTQLINDGAIHTIINNETNAEAARLKTKWAITS